MIEERSEGIFAILNDECSMATGSDRGFISKLKRHLLSHPNFYEIKHKPEYFKIQHYAGPVEYTSDGFVQKNKDNIPQDVWKLLATSKNDYVHELFNPPASTPASTPHGLVGPVARTGLARTGLVAVAPAPAQGGGPGEAALPQAGSLCSSPFRWGQVRPRS